MVSGIVKVGQLINWNTVFDCDSEDGVWKVYYYLPDGKTMLKIVLDAASKAALKVKRDQIRAFCDASITLSGVAEETWRLQPVTTVAVTKDEWVKR